MKLSDFTAMPHPTKAIFKKYGIKQATVAKFLDRGVSYTSGLLSGNVRYTAATDEKLWEFARMVEKEMSEKSGDNQAKTKSA